MSDGAFIVGLIFWFALMGILFALSGVSAAKYVISGRKHIDFFLISMMLAVFGGMMLVLMPSEGTPTDALLKDGWAIGCVENKTTEISVWKASECMDHPLQYLEQYGFNRPMSFEEENAVDDRNRPWHCTAYNTHETRSAYIVSKCWPFPDIGTGLGAPYWIAENGGPVNEPLLARSIEDWCFSFTGKRVFNETTCVTEALVRRV